MQIQIFSTGGTIDDIDSEKHLTKPRKTYIETALKQSRIGTGIVPIVKILMKKDSREMTDADRALIVNECNNCKDDRIIVTHGTFTMPKTATYIGKRIKNKTLVLTGSEIPFTKNKSDALFNLGSAIIAVQLLPAGVYIVINGMIFDWKNVRKNMKTHFFERISPRAVK